MSGPSRIRCRPDASRRPPIRAPRAAGTFGADRLSAVRVTARVDYAVRALVQLAADASVTPVKAEHLATAQQIPLKFLLEILRQLKQHKLLVSRRGPEGGYTLARPPAEIAIADVIRAVEGPLATVRDTSPATLDYEGPTESLRTVWIAVRGSLRHVLEDVTLQDVMTGRLPKHVVAIADKYGVDERP